MNYKYTGFLNDGNVIQDNNFKRIFKACVSDGIAKVRNDGFSRILQIYNNETFDRVCSLFFNQRRAQYGTDVSEVRVHRYHYDFKLYTKPVRTFTF